MRLVVAEYFHAARPLEKTSEPTISNKRFHSLRAADCLRDTSGERRNRPEREPGEKGVGSVKRSRTLPRVATVTARRLVAMFVDETGWPSWRLPPEGSSCRGRDQPHRSLASTTRRALPVGDASVRRRRSQCRPTGTSVPTKGQARAEFWRSRAASIQSSNSAKHR